MSLVGLKGAGQSEQQKPILARDSI